MCKGSNTTTTQSSANPAAMGAYYDLLNRAGGVASQPFQPYGGELTAPINAQQQAGIGSINQNAGFAQPFFDQAKGLAGQAATPLTAENIAQYQSPYTQQVVDATMRQFDQQNKQQQQNVVGNAAMQGALGGDRVGVAQANLAGQQTTAQAPVIAGLYNQGYNTALQTAQGQQQNLGNMAGMYGNLGVAGQNAALTGANAQLGAGNLMYGNEQQRLQSAYDQWKIQQAFPYQQAQWLAGIQTGVGSQMGGNSSTTAPPPNMAGQIIGAGVGVAGAAAAMSDRRAKRDISRIGETNDGQPIYKYRYNGSPDWQVGLIAQEVEKSHPDAVHSGVGGMKFVDLDAATRDAERAYGGRIAGFAGGGAPEESSSPFSGLGWIPGLQIVRGSGAPKAPNVPQQQQAAFDPSKFAGLGRRTGTDTAGTPLSLMPSGVEGFDSAVAGATLPMGMSPSAGFGMGPIYHDGGKVRGFADGGMPDLSDPRSSNWYVSRGFQDVGAVEPEPTEDPRVSDAGIVPMPRPRPADAPLASLALGPDDPDDPAMAYAPAARAPRSPIAGVAGGVPFRDVGAGGPRIVEHAPGGSPVYDNNAHLPGEEPALPPPPVAGVAGSGPTGDTETVDPVDGEEPKRGFDFSSLSMPLMAAGLGMMASRSPNLGNAIGEGGLAGVGAYAQQRQQEYQRAEKREDRAMTTRRLDQDLKRLDQAADRARAQLTEQSRHHKATEDYQRALLERENNKMIGVNEDGFPIYVNTRDGTETIGKTKLQGKAPAGYVRNPDGTMAPIKGGPADPEHIAAVAKAKSPNGGMLSDDTADWLAERVIAGDARALTNLGRGAQGAENIIKIQTLAAKKASERGMNASDVLAKVAEQSGLTAQQRTFGTQVAKMAVNATEAEGAIDMGREIAAKVPRTNWVPVNRAIQAFQSGTSDPKLAAFGAANLAIVNTYARAISPSGVPTVHDKEHAEKLLSTATGPDAYNAVLDTMKKEIAIAHAAPMKAKEEMERLRKSGTTGTHAPAAPTAAAPAAPPASPKKGDRVQFKQGWGVYDGTKWVPE